MSLSRKVMDHLLNGLTEDQVRETAGASSTILEQYKLYVDMADRISARRQAANSFFLGLNSAIIALSGYAAARNLAPPPLLGAAVSLSGAVLCVLWFRIVKSYRDLNTAKFLVVHEIERFLPLSPYNAEWSVVDRGSSSKLYLPVTHIELVVPWVFLLLHVAAFVGSLFVEAGPAPA